MTPAEREDSPEIFPPNFRRSTVGPPTPKPIRTNEELERTCIFSDCGLVCDSLEMLTAHVENHLTNQFAGAGNMSTGRNELEKNGSDFVLIDEDSPSTSRGHEKNVNGTATGPDASSRIHSNLLASCPFGCSFAGNSEMLQIHVETVHPDSASNDAPVETAVQRDKSKSNGDRRSKKRSRTPSPSADGKKGQRSKFGEDDESKDPDFSLTGEKSEGAPRSKRVLRPRGNKEEIDESKVARRELAGKIGKILEAGKSHFGYDVDKAHRQSLIQIATAIDEHFKNERNEDWDICYEVDAAGGDGYVNKFVARLRALIEVFADTALLFEFADVLLVMAASNMEYQMPDLDLMEKVQAGAGNGQRPPEFRVCSGVSFYGRDLGDSGWGCGYRNTQMLISSLLRWPAMRDHVISQLGSDQVPNIPRIQRLISEAWKKGFGLYCSVDLSDKVEETSTWIGPAEVQALFSSMRIGCLIKDFNAGSNDILEQLMNFVFDYFQEFADRGEDFVPPMFFQYSGHSRTIIGIDTTGWMLPCASGIPAQPTPTRNTKGKRKLERKEPTSKELGLMIYDPVDTQDSIAPTGRPTRKWYKEHIHCKMASFTEETYQILFFTGKVLDDGEYERMKVPGAAHHAISCSKFC